MKDGREIRAGICDFRGDQHLIRENLLRSGFQY